jgi:hypothetical protein
MVTELWHNHEVNQVMERITTSETGIVAHKEMLDTGEVENERPCQGTLKFGPEAEITWITRDRQNHCERAKNQGTRLSWYARSQVTRLYRCCLGREKFSVEIFRSLWAAANIELGAMDGRNSVFWFLKKSCW